MDYYKCCICGRLHSKGDAIECFKKCYRKQAGAYPSSVYECESPPHNGSKKRPYSIFGTSIKCYYKNHRGHK